MHTPTSTTDIICYRELGVLPIEYEIDIRRLTFLHHIVTLDEHDPVRVVYQQQSRFEYEENWHNDIKERLERYNIGESEEEIKDMKKEKWKRLVKGKVEDYAVEQINKECNEKKKTTLFTTYKEFNIEPYLVKMQPDLARTIFSIRAGVLDIKTYRMYKYNDTKGRLCNEEDEDIDHILKKCSKLPRYESLIRLNDIMQ